MCEGEIKLRVLATIYALPFCIVRAQWQLLLHRVYHLELRRVQVTVRPDNPIPEVAQHPGSYRNEQLQGVRNSRASTQRSRRKKGDKCRVHREEERVGLLSTSADTVGHFEIGLVDLERMVTVGRTVFVGIDALKSFDKPILHCGRHFAHGSNSRMADTMELVFQPTSLSAALDTTDETCSFAHGRIANNGLL